MAGSADDYRDRLVDEAALRRYLAETLGPADVLTIEYHEAGHSNETLFLTWGDRQLVLRRPPPGAVAETAHDVIREYRVLSALQETEARVPPTVVACGDHDVIGSDFYLMERVAGDVVRDVEPDRFAGPDHRSRIGWELVDALAEIHGVDFEAVGLADFGRPAGFSERQVERWRQQYAWAFDVTAERRQVPTVETVGEALAERVPPDHPETLVHGDYKLDNVLFAPGTPPRLASVFDWEMSALGDPRTDVGWLLSFWRGPDDPPPAVPELQPTFMARHGYPTRRDLVERYETLTGLDYDHDRFYRALAVFKLGALGEMFLRRHLEGNADDQLYPEMEAAVPKLAERAATILAGEHDL